MKFGHQQKTIKMTEKLVTNKCKIQSLNDSSPAIILITFMQQLCLM